MKRRQNNTKMLGNFWEEWIGETTKDESGGAYHPNDKNKLSESGRREEH